MPTPEELKRINDAVCVKEHPMADLSKYGLVASDDICFGNPRFPNTGVSAHVVVARFLGGDRLEELASEYGVSVTQIQAAVRFFCRDAPAFAQRPPATAQSEQWRALAKEAVKEADWNCECNVQVMLRPIADALIAAADECAARQERIAALADHYENRIRKLRAIAVFHAGTNRILDEDDNLMREWLLARATANTGRK